LNTVYSVGIAGIGSYVPSKVITNEDLSKLVDTSNEWIVQRTGIRERRIVDDSTSTSDIATIAAKRALQDGNITPEEIDLILVATLLLIWRSLRQLALFRKILVQ